MTAQKHLKQLIRTRMQKTGERYATARRHIISKTQQPNQDPATLAQSGPCVAWVDMAGLPHRAMPSLYSGGGYHVVVVYRINEEDGTALIGDLTDKPISISLTDLAQARARIKKQKNRVLSLVSA